MTIADNCKHANSILFLFSASTTFKNQIVKTESQKIIYIRNVDV